MPVELVRDGVRRVVEWDLAPAERRGMRQADVRVAAAAADIDDASAAR
nr:hypothetical protein [Streptomyces antibioticus]